MSTRFAAISTALLGLATIALATRADELPAAEKARIEKLIEHIKGLKDAVFVRNDVEYDAATAARFLQGKWDANAAEIRTAEQFIDIAASVSSTTGKPYRIRFKDGKEFKSGDYLKKRLKALP
jgi:hypothetical protein